MSDTPVAPPLGSTLVADLDFTASGIRVLALDEDGSRRIVQVSALGQRHVADISWFTDQHDTWVVWGPTGGTLSSQDFPIGHYLPYPPADGIAVASQTDPVNQYAYIPEWRANVATFCHSFDALPGFESFNQLSASQKVTAFRVGQTIGGHAWERLAFWLTYDASLSDDWKLPIVIDPVKKAIDAVCIECQSTVAALRLALNINATLFAAKLAAGHIHGTNRTATPWTPGDLLTVVPTPSEEVSVETAIAAHVAAASGARDYYHAHVAHEVTAHEHE